MADDVQGHSMPDQPTLRELLEQRICAERQARHDAWAAHGEIHRHEEEDRVRTLRQLEDWKAHVNMVREQIESERAHFVGREYYEAQHAELKTQVEKLAEAVRSVQERIANYDGRLVMLSLGLLAINTAIIVVSHLMGK